MYVGRGDPDTPRIYIKINLFCGALNRRTLHIICAKIRISQSAISKDSKEKIF